MNVVWPALVIGNLQSLFGFQDLSYGILSSDIAEPAASQVTQVAVPVFLK